MKRVLLSIPVAAAIVLIGSQFSYYLTGVALIGWTLFVFFRQFEQHHPSARELVLLSVLCALAVASRTVFAAVPHCKPVFGVLFLIGVATGPSSGFLCGAVTAFISNFFFGQGPWTPWQMLSFAVTGLLGGLFYARQLRLLERYRRMVLLAVCGFFSVLLIAGPILDTCSVFLMLSRLSVQGVISLYLAGLVPNAINASATAVTILLAGRPLLYQLQRLQTKYGLFSLR